MCIAMRGAQNEDGNKMKLRRIRKFCENEK